MWKKLRLASPDLYEWRNLSMEAFRTAMGGGNYRGREKLIAELKKLSAAFRPILPAVTLMIKNAAQTILQIKRQLNEMKKMMREITVRSDQGHKSNISLSAPNENDKECEGKIKRAKSNEKREKMVSVEKM
jgi:uncharacterized membrane protein